MSLVVAAINVVFGLLLAWVLVRDEFPGKRIVNALIDLPFALPTIVAGLTLIALYGGDNPLNIDIRGKQAGIALALLFVTLPFVVRSRAAGADRARQGDGGGGRVARRHARGRPSAASSSPTSSPRCCRARRSPSPARSASSARSS